jgi:hypothetical protein
LQKEDSNLAQLVETFYIEDLYVYVSERVNKESLLPGTANSFHTDFDGNSFWKQEIKVYAPFQLPFIGRSVYFYNCIFKLRNV